MSPVHLGKNLLPKFIQHLKHLDQNHCSKGPGWLSDGSSTRSRLQRFATIQPREFTAANNWFWVLELGNKLFQPLPEGVNNLPSLTCDIPQSVLEALKAKSQSTKESLDHLVTQALADMLQLDHATLFQISTAGALVEGVYKGAVSVGTLLKHGDFGLGTFDSLDGEMIVLDGKCYQARSDGTVTEADSAGKVPYAVVTHFQPQKQLQVPAINSVQELTSLLDGLRGTENLFFAFRIDGRFDQVKMRAVCKATGHERLVESAANQAEFTHTALEGTLVSFWTPSYAKNLGIPGYHLHFISTDRKHGGHLLDCSGSGWKVQMEQITDFRMAIPETKQFLQANLAHDPSKDLEKAER